MSRLTGLRLKFCTSPMPRPPWTSKSLLLAGDSFPEIGRNEHRSDSVLNPLSLSFYAFSSALPMLLLCQPSLGWPAGILGNL